VNQARASRLDAVESSAVETNVPQLTRESHSSADSRKPRMGQGNSLVAARRPTRHASYDRPAHTQPSSLAWRSCHQEEQPRLVSETNWCSATTAKRVHGMPSVVSVSRAAIHQRAGGWLPSALNTPSWRGAARIPCGRCLKSQRAATARRHPTSGADHGPASAVSPTTPGREKVVPRVRARA